MTWIHVGLGTGFVPKPIEALALLAVIGAAWAAQAKAEGWAFTAAAIGMAGDGGCALQRAVPPRHGLEHQRRLQPHDRRTRRVPSYTLKVMTVVAVVFFPIVLIYQAWGYHVFRKRLSVPRVGGDESESAVPPAAGTSTPAETS